MKKLIFPFTLPVNCFSPFFVSRKELCREISLSVVWFYICISEVCFVCLGVLCDADISLKCQVSSKYCNTWLTTLNDNTKTLHIVNLLCGMAVQGESWCALEMLAKSPLCFYTEAIHDFLFHLSLKKISETTSCLFNYVVSYLLHW